MPDEQASAGNERSLGHSEEVVGRALREIPATERPYVFTKGGMVPIRRGPSTSRGLP